MKWGGESGRGMGTYAAEIERSDLFGEGGFLLRVVRRERPLLGQLAEMKWLALADGEAPSYALSNADAAGDMAGFLQAIMDASWRAGLRPTSFGVEDVGMIESQKAHIKSLERQVEMQHTVIEKLLGK